MGASQEVALQIHHFQFKEFPETFGTVVLNAQSIRLSCILKGGIQFWLLLVEGCQWDSL